MAQSALQSQKVQNTRSRALLEVKMLKKCTTLLREAHFEVNMYKASHSRSTLASSSVALCGKRDGFCTLSKVIAFSETMAGVGQLKKICKDSFRRAGAVQETHESDMLGGQGAGLLSGVACWSIRSSGLLRWLCVKGAALSYDLASLFPGRRNTLDTWSGKNANALARSRQFCAQHSVFEGSLAELLRF